MHTRLAFWERWGVWGLMALLFALALGRFIFENYQVGMRSWNLITSGILLSVPLALLFLSIGLIILAGMQKRGGGQLSPRLAKFLYIMPRAAGLLIILFVGMFSLDVFGQGYGFWETALAFLMHSLPSIVMAVVLALAWRRPVIGFVAFLLAALFFLRFLIGGRILENFGSMLLFSGPMAVIALMFWLNWRWQKEMDAARGPVHRA